ncbi:hypothetical protein [Mesorhizobium prunaredense]|uniref:hypothetical protein n=1 Tax=Mesorhizobium prunaredense TaxID=1631249 RepID=UPI001180B0AD|nr:hypothetical protein [Mesorhizobium prunaredense]
MANSPGNDPTQLRTASSVPEKPDQRQICSENRVCSEIGSVQKIGLLGKSGVFSKCGADWNR